MVIAKNEIGWCSVDGRKEAERRVPRKANTLSSRSDYQLPDCHSAPALSSLDSDIIGVNNDGDSCFCFVCLVQKIIRLWYGCGVEIYIHMRLATILDIYIHCEVFLCYIDLN